MHSFEEYFPRIVYYLRLLVYSISIPKKYAAKKLRICICMIKGNLVMHQSLLCTRSGKNDGMG